METKTNHNAAAESATALGRMIAAAALFQSTGELPSKEDK